MESIALAHGKNPQGVEREAIPPKYGWLLCLGVFVFALILRLLFIQYVPPIPILSWSDDAYYQGTAERLYHLIRSAPAILHDLLGYSQWKGTGVLSAHGLEFPFGIFYRNPGYPFFLALVYGVAGGIKLHAAYIAQALVSALSCVLVYVLGKRLTTPRIGIWAAFFCAVYLPFMICNTLLLQQTLAAFLLLCLIWISLLAVQKQSGSICVLAGILLATVVLERPALQNLFWIYIPVFSLAILREVSLSLHRARKLIAGFLAGFILPMLLWMGMLAHEFGHWGMISAAKGGASSLFRCALPQNGGWCTDDDRSGLGPSAVQKFHDLGIDWEPKLRETWPPDSLFIEATKRLIVSRPMDFFVLTVNKVRRLWDRPELFPWDEMFRSPAVMLWIHRLIVALALIGLVLYFNKSLGFLLIATVLGYLSLLHGVSQAFPRYALPGMPLVILLATHAGTSILGWMRRGPWWIFFSYSARIRFALGVALFAIPWVVWARTDGLHKPFYIRLLRPADSVSVAFELPSDAKGKIRSATLWVDMHQESNIPNLRLTMRVQDVKIKEWAGGFRVRKNPFMYDEYPDLFSIQGRSAESVPQWIGVPIPRRLLKNSSRVSVKIDLETISPSSKAGIVIAAYRQKNPASLQWEGPRISPVSSNTSALKYLYDGEARLWGTHALDGSSSEVEVSTVAGSGYRLPYGTRAGIRLELQLVNSDHRIL